MKLYIALIFISFFILGSMGNCTLPVIDWASLAKQAQEISALSDQLVVARQQLISMTGVTNLGQWKNAAEDLREREWTPSDWTSALNLDLSGNSDRLNQFISEYTATHPALNAPQLAHYQEGASQVLNAIVTEQLHHDQLSQSMASGAYAEVNQDFKDLHDLGLQIGDGSKDPDLKHAVDLNSRVQLEVGNLATQEIRMLALLNQQMAQSQATALEQQQDASAYLSQDIRS